MEQPRKNARQTRALATRERILAHAARLFALKGYHDTKLEELLRAAQITTGAFFHHFASKEELAFAVLDRHMQRRREELDAIERRLPPECQDEPLLRIGRRLDAIVAMVRRREHRRGGCIIGNLSTSLSDTHEAFRRRLADCFDQMAAEFKPHLDEALRLYRPRPRPDTWALARHIVAVVEGAIMLARTHRDPALLARQCDYLKECLARSLRGQTPARITTGTGPRTTQLEPRVAAAAATRRKPMRQRTTPNHPNQ